MRLICSEPLLAVILWRNLHWEWWDFCSDRCLAAWCREAREPSAEAESCDRRKRQWTVSARSNPSSHKGDNLKCDWIPSAPWEYTRRQASYLWFEQSWTRDSLSSAAPRPDSDTSAADWLSRWSCKHLCLNHTITHNCLKSIRNASEGQNCLFAFTCRYLLMSTAIVRPS